MNTPTAESLRSTLLQASLEPWAAEDRLGLLAHFTRWMLEANQEVNLTRWVEEEQVRILHILDSAFAFPLLQELSKGHLPYRVLDLGTGCGFPGAAVAAAFPQWEVTLMDATSKKVQILSKCASESGLRLETLHARAEELGRIPQRRESWDLVTARAVADLPVLLELALPLLKTGGHLVDWLTEDQMSSVDKSSNALRWLEGKVVKKKEYSLPGQDKSRWQVVVEKVGKTPMRYPRPSGQPAKHPL